MAHEDLKQAALEALTNLHSDTSVSMETTIDSLEEIQERVGELIGMVKIDIQNRDGGQRF